MRMPIVSKYPGPTLLKRRRRGIVPSASGKSSTASELPLSSPSMVSEDERPTAVPPATLGAPEARHRALGVGAIVHGEVVGVGRAVHGDGRREANGRDARHSRQPFRDGLLRARRLLWIADEARRYREEERLNLLRAS